MTLWDRIGPWLLHPFRTAALTFVFRYLEDHPTLEIRFKDHVD